MSLDDFKFLSEQTLWRSPLSMWGECIRVKPAEAIQGAGISRKFSRMTLKKSTDVNESINEKSQIEIMEKHTGNIICTHRRKTSHWWTNLLEWNARSNDSVGRTKVSSYVPTDENFSLVNHSLEWNARSNDLGGMTPSLNVSQYHHVYLPLKILTGEPFTRMEREKYDSVGKTKESHKQILQEFTGVNSIPINTLHD